MRRIVFRYFAFLVCVGVMFTPVVNATISGVSSYQQVAGGALDGWYRYEVAVTWNTSAASKKGASHMDILLDGGITCPGVLAAIQGDDAMGAYDPLNDNPYFRFEPDNPLDTYYEGVSGLSTTEDNPLNPLAQVAPWFAYIAMSDSGPVPPIVDTIMIKYEQPVHLASDPLLEAPGTAPANQGIATFWYYSVFGPGTGQDASTVWTDKLMVKAGNGGGIVEFGDITGYMPDCVPEPATICLLGLGTLGLLRKRKR